MMKRSYVSLLVLALLAPNVSAASASGGGKTWCGTSRQGAGEAVWAHTEQRSRRGAAQIAASGAAFDVGQIAVLQDEGDLALLKNLFNLQGAALRFIPAGGGYSVSRISLPLEPATGAPISLMDDDTARMPLSFDFTFYGRRYRDIFVNSDGNLTFGEGDAASTARNVSRLVSGPPRIAPILADFNPEKGGTVSARDAGDHFTVTWTGVPQFDKQDSNTFQVALWSDGHIDFVYDSNVAASIVEGAVGVAPGGGLGGLTSVDFTSATGASGAGALVESFRSEDGLDTIAVARKFYQTHSDDYQQLIIYTSRSLIQSGSFAYEETVQNKDRGIGVDLLDLSASYGSHGHLESVVDMDAITKYPDDLNQRFLGEDSTLTVLAHEVGHRWLAQAVFKDGSATSRELLGRAGVHWSFFFNSNGSYLEGNEITDVGGGSFRTTGASLRYSPLDQYLMGLRSPSEVGSSFVVRQPLGAGSDAGRNPQTGITFAGTRKDVTIEDIIAALGSRNPPTAPTTPFREAFVYVAVGGPADPTAIQKIERIRAAWPSFFLQSTEGRSTVDPRLN